jgi:hypothetical protein
MVQSQTASHVPWARWLIYCSAFFACSGAPVWAQAALKNEPPGFLVPLEMQRPQLAALVIGSAAQPVAGPLAIFAGLHAGEREQVWVIEPPFLSKKIQVQVGASLLFLAGLTGIGQQSLDIITWLKLGDALDFWTLVDTDKIRRIREIPLLRVTDETPLPDPVNGNDPELDAYFDMVIYAGQTATKAFYDQARHDLKYTHLMNQPRKCRGEVVYLEGRLRRLERTEAPAEVRLAGFKYLYEGWFFINNNGAAPVCVVFSELPEGLALGDKLNDQIGFAGYFYKKYRYNSGISGKQVRFAPLLIGRSPRVLRIPGSGTGDDPNQGLLPLFLSLVAATFLAVLLMAFYFRYNDLKVHQRLVKLTDQEFILPGADQLEEKKFAGEVTNYPPEATEYQDGSGLASAPRPHPLSFPDRPTLN